MGRIAGSSFFFISAGVLKAGLYSVPGSSSGKVIERFFLLIEPLETIEPLSSTKFF
jgi:hypothetical protein